MILKNEDILQLKQDEYISDIIDIEINSLMSVSTLYALETIYYLRFQLAQVSLEKNKAMIEALCRKKLKQLAEALMEKYATADSVNKKIEIIERIEVITLILTGRHSIFALEKASLLEDLPDLTYAQDLRLKWLPALTPEDDSKIVAELLPQTASSFELATLALISDFCTDEERAAIFGRFLELFDAALSVNDTAELGSLLALAACWNSNPAVRYRLSEIVAEAAKTTEVVTVAANQVATVAVDRVANQVTKETVNQAATEASEAVDQAVTVAANQADLLEGLSLPEKRVNAIAATIYAQIDTITGKYADVEDIPA